MKEDVVLAWAIWFGLVELWLVWAKNPHYYLP